MAQILQRRRNHDTFVLRRIDVDARPDLAERFGVAHVPVLVVVAENVRARLDDVRGCRAVDEFLSPWLKR